MSYIMWNLEQLDITAFQRDILVKASLIYEVDSEEYPGLFYPTGETEYEMEKIEAAISAIDTTTNSIMASIGIKE